MPQLYLDETYEKRLKKNWKQAQSFFAHIDWPLLLSILCLETFGLIILYSASDQSLFTVVKQSLWFLLGLISLLCLAQIPPQKYQQWSPWIFTAGVFFLILVLLMGHIGQGARRWIGWGGFHFQPSEIMKLATPMMIAWFLQEKTLPLHLKTLGITLLLVSAPVLLTAKQPDLGTAIVIAIAGLSVIVLAGLSWKIILSVLGGMVLSGPLLWNLLHGYQKQRILTFLNPEQDPLGAGYHIIQSKIAVGSGGIVGKGFLHGTQSHLAFLPEHTTDFIFAVASEEFGFLGATLILVLVILITLRIFYISLQAQSAYTRLLSASLGITFLCSSLINMGMVSGILPVVGIPLPFISYGGSALLINLIEFGILMSIATHKKLWNR